MLDSIAVREAFRARVSALVVATTGTATLGANAAGYTRAAGSFLSDGFAAGMEVTGTGFSAGNNTPSIVDTVTALTMTIANGRTVESAAGSRVLSAGLPLVRVWEGTATPSATAIGVRPYVIEQRQSLTDSLVTFPAEGGETEETGFYILTWFALGNKGISALQRGVDALRALFRPGTVVSPSANTVRIIRAPTVGQFIPTDTGYLSCQIAIHWAGLSVNAVIGTASRFLLESGSALLLEDGSTLLLEAA